MLQIRLLGQFDVRLDGKRIVISSRAGQSLLAYLAMTAGTPHRREKLAGTLWPESSEDNARKNLRQELWRIRKAIPNQSLSAESDYLLSDEYTITFNRDADFWLDVAILERPDIDPQSLTSSLSLYQGELLPGFYDDWVVFDRERIQTLFESKMERLVGVLVDAERWTGVQEQCERWLALGNAPEPAYRALMLSHSARGDMAKVSSVYQRCVDDLRDRFGVEPSAETHALYNGLLKGARAPRRIIPAQPSGTVTFLFTDIQGSTRLLDKLGEQYATSLAEHHKILRAAIEKWHGKEMDTQGDAFFVTFTRALDAVQCAAEAQRELASHSWPMDEPIRVRMGLHTGEPLIASTGYVGMDVHRAARIGDAGHGGQVLLSQTTRDLTIQDLPQGMAIRDLGEHRLKDMKYPTPIYQLVIEGLQTSFPPLKTKFTGTEAPTPGEPPFKGLQYFEESDSDLFFGRELLTAKLVNRIRETQFLSVIIGASGSGKSSLVRAGLVPVIKEGKNLVDDIHPPKDSTGWQIHIITPTAHPLQALATELTRDSESVTAIATLLDDLTNEPRSLSLFLLRKNPKNHILLVVDQFEELFTLCRDEFEREAFIDNLLTAITPSPLKGERQRTAAGGRGETRITLVITLRADFYAHLAQYPELRDAVAKQQEYIGPMTTEELRSAIEEPAKRGHWEFEPGLVDLILRDVGDEPGALPLLSHALLETWKRRAGHTLTLKGYADAGGVHGAIAHTAESVYQTLTSKEQTIAHDIFLRLTELGEGTEDTRRRASFVELMSSAENAQEVRAVLNILADARLVTLGEDTAEVAHEALIREWPTLREWLNQDREGLRLHRHLTEAAHDWELLGRDPGALYRGAHLAQAREWAILHPKVLNATERAFLDASIGQEEREEQEREEQQQRELEAARKLAETEHARAKDQAQSANRLRIRNRVITTVGVITVLLAISALSFSRQSNTNAANAEKNAQSALNAQATAQVEAQSRATQQVIAQTNFIHADALRLASEANKLLLSQGNDAQLISLLSIRSMNTEYTPQGDQALGGAMTLSFPRLVFGGHTDEISYADYSPDGKYVLTSSLDKTARLWDVQTGKELRRFAGHTDGIYSAAFSPDGKYIATTGGGDRTVRLWDTQTGKTVKTFTHSDPVFGLAYSPDGKYIVFVGFGGTANLLDIQTFQVVRTYTQPGQIFAMAFSQDGKYLLTGGKQRIGHLWNVQTGKEIRQFSSPGSVRQAAFSPDGKYLVTGGEESVIRMWDVDTGQDIRTFVGHTATIGSLVFSKDGKYVLSDADDGTVRLWNAQTGDQIRVLAIANTEASINSNGRAVFSPDGKYIFTATHRTGLLWEMTSVIHPGLPQFVKPNDPVYNAIFSPDGKYILTSTAGENRARLWDIQTREPIRDFCCLTDYVNSLVFSADGKYVLTGGGNGDNTARIWDRQTSKELLKINGSTDDRGLVVVFSPDGKYFVTSSTHVILWDAKTGEQIREFIGHTDRVWAVAFSPNSHYLLTGSWDGTTRLWDVQTGKKLQIFTPASGDEVDSLAYSSDGRYILTGGLDHLVRLWDVETGKELREFTGHTGPILTVVFSPDGRYALSASGDSTARLWDIATGVELRRFIGHIGAVIAAFSPDGKYVLTGGDDGIARIWFVDYHDEIKYLCTHLTRDFTDEERRQYEINNTKPTCPKP